MASREWISGELDDFRARGTTEVNNLHVQWTPLGTVLGISLRIGSSRSMVVIGEGVGGNRICKGSGGGASNASGISMMHTYPARRAV